MLAPPDRHMVVCEDRTLALSREPEINYARPAADLLFESASAVYGPRVLAAVLSGRGRDGALGCRAIKNRGGIVLVQDEATSVSFDMPRAAIETGAVDFVLPLSDLGPATTTFVSVPGAAKLFEATPSFALSHAQRLRRRHTLDRLS